MTWKKNFKPTHNPILQNIENFDQFNWFSKILTKLLNPITHLTVSSLAIGEKNNWDHKIHSLAVTFFLHTYTQVYSRPCVQLYTNIITLVNKVKKCHILPYIPAFCAGSLWPNSRESWEGTGRESSRLTKGAKGEATLFLYCPHSLRIVGQVGRLIGHAVWRMAILLRDWT